MTPVVQVVVLTPLGEGGRGGIDRLMDELRPVFRDRASDATTVRFLITRGAFHILWSPLYLASAAISLVWYKLAGKVDVVHINLATDGSTYRKLQLAFLARVLRIPYVIHLHGAEFHKFWDKASPWLDRALMRLFSRASAIIVLGAVWARYIGGKIPASADKIVVIPNATRDTLASRPKEQHAEPLNILFLGQLGPRKGIPQLIAAFERMRGDEWHATLAGDGAVDQTRVQIRNLGLEDRCRVPGWVDDNSVRALLSSADILVLPSFDENLPMSVIEACAHRLAIVTTPVGAVEDIIRHDDTGLLIPPGDVDALTAALKRLIDDPALRARLGRNARAVYDDRLNLDVFVRRLTETWRSAAGL